MQPKTPHPSFVSFASLSHWWVAPQHCPLSLKDDAKLHLFSDISVTKLLRFCYEIVTKEQRSQFESVANQTKSLHYSCIIIAAASGVPIPAKIKPIA